MEFRYLEISKMNYWPQYRSDNEIDPILDMTEG
jgi:hypothetical protein